MMLRALLLTCCLVVLPGCELLELAQPESAPAATDREAANALHNRKLATLEAWSIDGRISVRLGEEAWHATILWQQIDQAYHIRMFGPFGSGAIQLDGSPHSVVLVQDGQALHSQDPEQLFYERVGWRVPLNGLRYWAVGQPVPDRPVAIELDTAGRLASLQQDGWAVRYRSYVEAGGYSLPGKIFIDNQGLDIRLVIDRWQTTGQPGQ